MYYDSANGSRAGLARQHSCRRMMHQKTVLRVGGEPLYLHGKCSEDCLETGGARPLREARWLYVAHVWPRRPHYASLFPSTGTVFLGAPTAWAPRQMFHPAPAEEVASRRSTNNGRATGQQSPPIGQCRLRQTEGGGLRGHAGWTSSTPRVLVLAPGARQQHDRFALCPPPPSPSGSSLAATVHGFFSFPLPRLSAVGAGRARRAGGGEAGKGAAQCARLAGEVMWLFMRVGSRGAGGRVMRKGADL